MTFAGKISELSKLLGGIQDNLEISNETITPLINEKYPTGNPNRARAFIVLDEISDICKDTTARVKNNVTNGDPLSEEDKQIVSRLTKGQKFEIFKELIVKADGDLSSVATYADLLGDEDNNNFINGTGGRQSLLLEYLAMGEVQEVKSLLEIVSQNPQRFTIDVNQQDSEFFANSALHLCAAKGWGDKNGDNQPIALSYHEIARNLIAMGGDPNARNGLNGKHDCTESYSKYTPLDLAVARRDLEMVDALCSGNLSLQTIEQAQGYIAQEYDACRNIIDDTLGTAEFTEEDFKWYTNMPYNPAPEEFQNAELNAEILARLELKKSELTIEDAPSRTPSPTNEFANIQNAGCCLIS